MMRFGREDYETSDPHKVIPAGEPVFLLRAQDVNAPDAVHLWADLAERSGAAPEIVSNARLQARLMKAWQESHGAKVADLPHGDPATIKARTA